MAIAFTATPGILQRTVFTKNGPIVKKPLILAQGVDLQIESTQNVRIPTGFFDSTYEGKYIKVVGTPGARNDGEFFIAEVLSSTRLVLEAADFDVSDVAATTSKVVAFSNALRTAFNSHIVQDGVHLTDDSVHEVTAAVATNLVTAYTLLADLKAQFSAHLVEMGVHKYLDEENTVFGRDPDSIASAVNLARELLYRYNLHRNSFEWHVIRDSINRTVTGFQPSLNAGPMIGPFTWQLYDPRFGQIADSSSDVRAYINGLPVDVEAVFGLYGAVVLTLPWAAGNLVTIDYEWMYDPPVQMANLNDWSFGLNQDQNRNFGGFLDHRNKFRTFLADPARFNDGLIRSAQSPYTAGWKYKGYERAYLAALNDPTLLLFNTPFNRVSNPAYTTQIVEESVSYDPVALPNPAEWIRTGVGTVAIENAQLVITDAAAGAHAGRNVNFYSRPARLDYPSQTFSAWRFSVDAEILDGCFTGVGFGVADGSRIVLVGCIRTEATNLTSACEMANSILAKYNTHLKESGVHRPDDTTNSLSFVPASNLFTLASLLQALKVRISDHMAAGPETVHSVVDSLNVPMFADLNPEFTSLEDALLAVNELWVKYNAHLVEPTIHYKSDTVNACPLVRQLGVLSASTLESSYSWTAFAHDWSQLATVRLERDSSGNARLFVPGEIEPRVIVEVQDLPFMSDVDIELPQFESSFFGSVGDESTSTSRWERIRLNTIPEVSYQFVNRKLVTYSPSTLPENAPTSPWNHVGLSGTSFLKSGLVIDNTAFIPSSEVVDYGLMSGNYQGFVRVEPILNSEVVTICDFTTSLQSWTFGIGNAAHGVFVNYRDLSVPLVFLQSDPTPAVVEGTTVEPFSIQAGESFTVSLDDGEVKTVTFPAPLTSAASVVTEINTQVGSVIAVADAGRVGFRSLTRGNSASIEISSGSALARLGILPGTYRGLDTNPEPRISYSGADFPENTTPAWTRTGEQLVKMIGRKLQILDSDPQDFTSYALTDTQVVSPVLSGGLDWKTGVRIQVEAFVPGSIITTGSNLVFCGVLLNIEEGAGGKSVDFHLSVSQSGSPYVSVYSYNSTTGALVSQLEVPFAWNDGKFHTYNIYTNKASDMMLVLADNQLLGTFSYSSLSDSASTPSITFGSGGNPAANGILTTARSSVLWENVSVFRDSKLQDPDSPNQRYIGVFKGGDPRALDSYVTHAVDWTVPHNYRLVCDPTTAITVYVDADPNPVISLGYNSLNLASRKDTFLDQVTSGRPAIAFGGFDSQELSRSTWTSFVYSMRAAGNYETLVAPHQVLNYANVMASPDHLFTSVDHLHYGFRISSSGVPTDDFQSLSTVESYTNLLEGTPPVPATQNLETRGGLVKNIQSMAGNTIPSIFMENGGLRTFQNDTANTAVVPDTYAQMLAALVSGSNSLRTQYEAHRVSVTAHLFADNTNAMVAGVCADLASAITLLNDLKAKYNAHRLNGTSHVSPDTYDVVTSPTAVDFATAATLYDELAQKFGSHVFFSEYHAAKDVNNIITGPDSIDLASAIVLLNDLKAKYNLHRVSLSYHVAADNANSVATANATDLATGVTLATAIGVAYAAHKSSTTFHQVGDSDHNMLAAPAATEDSLVAFANAAKAAYNSHIRTVPVHYVPDTEYLVLGPSIVLLPYLCGVLNKIKTGYNAHTASTTLHLVSGTSVATANATDLATANALAASIQSTLDAHTASNVSHRVPSPTNIGTLSFGTLSQLTEAVQKIQMSYTDHLSRRGTHGLNDTVGALIVGPAPTTLVDGIAILNSLKSEYNLHRLRPGVHLTPDTTYAVGTPDATDAISAQTLSNSMRQALKSHIISSTFHNVSADDDALPTNDGTLAVFLQLVDSMRALYVQHITRSISGTFVHGVNDTVNTVSTPSPATVLVRTMEDHRTRYNAHLSNVESGTAVHFTDARTDASTQMAVYSSTAFQLSTVYSVIQELASKFNSHITRWDGDPRTPSVIHRNADFSNTLAPAGVTTIESAISRLASFRTGFNAHIGGRDVHLQSTAYSQPVAVAGNPQTYLFAKSTEFAETLNDHFANFDSHPGITTSVDAVSPSSVQEFVDFVNALKFAYNSHLASSKAHVNADTTNGVATADATDLLTASALLAQLVTAYNAHRVQSGVHGGLVLIELTVPNRVLYNSMKFFIEESGEKGLVSSISEEYHYIRVYNTVSTVTTDIPI